MTKNAFATALISVEQNKCEVCCLSGHRSALRPLPQGSNWLPRERSPLQREAEKCQPGRRQGAYSLKLPLFCNLFTRTSTFNCACFWPAARQTCQRAGLCPSQLSNKVGRAEAGGDEPAEDAHQSQAWPQGGKWWAGISYWRVINTCSVLRGRGWVTIGSYTCFLLSSEAVIV